MDEPDPAEAMQAIVPCPPILELNPRDAGLGSIIWCTGFTYDLSWVDLQILAPTAGRLTTEGSVSPVRASSLWGCHFGLRGPHG